MLGGNNQGFKTGFKMAPRNTGNLILLVERGLIRMVERNLPSYQYQFRANLFKDRLKFKTFFVIEMDKSLNLSPTINVQFCSNNLLPTKRILMQLHYASFIQIRINSITMGLNPKTCSIKQLCQCSIHRIRQTIKLYDRM